MKILLVILSFLSLFGAGNNQTVLSDVDNQDISSAGEGTTNMIGRQA